MRRHPVSMRGALFAIALAAFVPGAGAAPAPCSEAARTAGWVEPAVEGYRDLAALTAYLAGHRVIYVGETHDRFEQHLTQLEIICRLREHGRIAIGAEFFQAPAQDALDDFVKRHGDLGRLLRESQWFTRWGYDPRLYEPILRFARDRRIRLIALNVPGELVRKVARGGLDELSGVQRARLPAAVIRGPDAYRQRIRQSFDQHPNMGMEFEDFLTAQLMWDEGMAQRGAEFVLAHPHTKLVVLAGEEHVRNGDGIPDRLARRTPGPHVIVLQSEATVDRSARAHVRVLTDPLALPPAGRLGVKLGPHRAGDDGAVEITAFTEDSAARDAGLAPGDRLVAVDHQSLREPGALRLALWNREPGSPLAVTVRRGDTLSTLILTLR